MVKRLPPDIGRTAALFSGLAHPTRLQILEALRGTEPLSPKQMAAIVEPTVTLGTISHHARELCAVGLLARAGTRQVRGALQHFYRLTPNGRELMVLVDRVAGQDASAA